MTNNDQIIVLGRIDRPFDMDKPNRATSDSAKQTTAPFLTVLPHTDMNRYGLLYVPYNQLMKTLTAPRDPLRRNQQEQCEAEQAPKSQRQSRDNLIRGATSQCLHITREKPTHPFFHPHPKMWRKLGRGIF